jgi:hypothetical protein
MRTAVGLCLPLLLTACGGRRGPVTIATTPPALEPARATRLEVLAVQDSTFTIAVRGLDWVREGQRGIVVNPCRRDALVARFTVLRRGAAEATAVVTGQTTRVATDQVALLEAPLPVAGRRAAWRRGWWTGLLVGGAVGAGVGLATR